MTPCQKFQWRAFARLGKESLARCSFLRWLGMPGRTKCQPYHLVLLLSGSPVAWETRRCQEQSPARSRTSRMVWWGTPRVDEGRKLSDRFVVLDHYRWDRELFVHNPTLQAHVQEIFTYPLFRIITRVVVFCCA
jgi:hypothetical protein